MIHIVYTTFTEKLPEEVYTHWFNKLTLAMQIQVTRFRHWQDAQRGLLGKALLLRALAMHGHEHLSLHDLRFNDYQKPIFEDGPQFNISHSGNVIACAVSNELAVGIDVEEVKPIPLHDFSDLFSPQELDLIYNDRNDYLPFYNLWTKKEAFLKAVGIGLNTPLRNVQVQGNTIEFDSLRWYIYPLDICAGYVCNLATLKSSADISIQPVNYNYIT